MDQFVELLRAAQGGHGMENLARVYGLSTQQAQAVADALMPAFADGFRHVTQSPEAMASLMALMLTGPYSAYYSQPASFAPPAQFTPPPNPQQPLNQAGIDALNTVFGSSEVSQAVANHVAATTGLGIAAVRQMMPTYAALFVGGLAKALAASGAMQTMMAALLSRLPVGQPEARSAPISSGNPWIDAVLAFTASSASNTSFSSGNPWADAFARVMFQPAAMPAAPQRATPGNAWQDVVSAMANTLAQASGQPAAAAPPPPPPPPAPPPAAVNPLQPFQDFFARMFAQGFPPSFPAGQTGAGEARAAAPMSFPEFWLDLMTRAQQSVPQAEILPPEKPRLVKGQKDDDGR